MGEAGGAATLIFDEGFWQVTSTITSGNFDADQLN